MADLPVVRSIFERALVLDESWDRGALHDVMIGFDSLPPAMGGNFARAGQHFARAIELYAGRRAGPYVTWARLSTVPRQVRGEFREMIAKAQAVDPEASVEDGLANRIAQRWAAILEQRIDDYFFDEDEAAETAEEAAHVDPN